MPYLVLGLGVLVGMFLIIRGLAAINPRRAIQAIMLSFILIAGGTAAYLAVSRGLGAILMALAFLVPVFLRWRSTRRYFHNLGGPQDGQNTGVETRYLRMSLDHDTGTVDGVVLEGRFRGRHLSELGEDELMELLRECRVEDQNSASVLEAYLDRVHGAAWRGGDARDAGAKAGNGAGGRDQGQRGGPAGGGSMTREEAYEVLGLAPGATAEQVKEAHHRLMKKIHPDQGGSNYLATKINQAKALLLGE